MDKWPDNCGEKANFLPIDILLHTNAIGGNANKYEFHLREIPYLYHSTRYL
jgi:hypothetical protein